MKALFPPGLLIPALLLAGMLSTGCVSLPQRTETKQQEAFFVTKVKPVLQYYCIECHTDQAAPQYGGFSMETGHSAMTTGRHAPRHPPWQTGRKPPLHRSPAGT